MFVLAGICRKHTPLSIRRILCLAGRLKCIGYILVLYQLPLVATIVTFHKSVCFACLCVIKQVIHMFFFFFICRPALSRLVIRRGVIGVKVLLGLAVNLVLHIFRYAIHIIFHVIFAGVTILFYPVAGIIFVTGRACYRTNQNVFSIKPQIARVIRRLRVFPFAGISRKHLALTISGVLCFACGFQRIQRFLICHFYPAAGFCFIIVCPLPAFLAVGVIKQITVVRFLCGVVFPAHSRPVLKRRVIVIKILFNLAVHLFLQLVNFIHIIFQVFLNLVLLQQVPVNFIRLNVQPLKVILRGNHSHSIVHLEQRITRNGVFLAKSRHYIAAVVVQHLHNCANSCTVKLGIANQSLAVTLHLFCQVFQPRNGIIQCVLRHSFSSKIKKAGQPHRPPGISSSYLSLKPIFLYI